MPRAISYHFGLQKLDRYEYENWPELPAARQDAIDLCAIARKQGFDATLCIDDEAKCADIRNAITRAENELDSGDVLLLTFAGHGRRSHTFQRTRKFPEKPPGCGNPPAESEGWDSSLCFYDGRIIDNEFYSFWCRLKKGVRVVMIIDSCESGSMFGLLPFSNDTGARLASIRSVDPSMARTETDVITVWPEIDVKPELELHMIPPTVLIMSASKDSSIERNGKTNGAFTGGFLSAWRSKENGDTYTSFFQKVCREARKEFALIAPSFRVIGPSQAAMNGLAGQKPLSIWSEPDHFDNLLSRNNPMARPSLTITVSATSTDIPGTPIRNAPVILFNRNMTINRVGFTYQDGITVFLDVPAGRYILMAIHPEAKRFQAAEIEFTGTDPLLNVLFSDDLGDRGKIIATVLVGSTKRSGVDVILYPANSSTAIMSNSTNTAGEVEFNGLGGTYDVKAIGSDPETCVDLEEDVTVGIGPNVVIPVLLELGEDC